ncbi:MAG: hypothetical protein M3464_00405 [Chloroflexota bacterium]|nr:hypothetical protein [Chloroflexota bacterium]
MPDTLARAREHRFDQLPVLDGDGRFRGLFDAGRAEKRHRDGRTIASDHDAFIYQEVPEQIELFELLDAFEPHSRDDYTLDGILTIKPWRKCSIQGSILAHLSQYIGADDGTRTRNLLFTNHL